MSNEKSSWDQVHSGNTRARGLGAKLTAEAKRASYEPLTAETLGSAAVAGSVLPEPKLAAEEPQARTHVGFATEPGYNDAGFDAWGGRQVDENPHHF